jgi:hypothetical protein
MQFGKMRVAIFGMQIRGICEEKSTDPLYCGSGGFYDHGNYDIFETN